MPETAAVPAATPAAVPANPVEIHQIAIDQIDDTGLTRDRSGLDQAAMTELRISIAANGLRLPIEVYALAQPSPPYRYGLISGLRRLAAFRALHQLTGQNNTAGNRYTSIPAFVRTPGSLAQAMTAMVEENEIRAGLSPWERGRIAHIAQTQGIFGTIEDAVHALYPAANRAKRARLRGLAYLAAELDGYLAWPEQLSQNQALRLAAAVQAGFGELIRTALSEASLDAPEAQWDLLVPILAEAETHPASAPRPRPGRPRRVFSPRHGLTIRREMTRDGWALHFTGREATSALLDAVFDEIERIFAPGE